MLKAQVDTVQQQEAILKECIQPWLNEAFSISTTLEGKVVHMQAVCDTEKVTASDKDALAAHLEKV